MDKMKRLSEAIRSLMEGEFSGYIKINFTQGSLGRIEKSEEFEEDSILCMGKDGGKSSGVDRGQREVFNTLPVIVLLSLVFSGCATSGAVKPLSSGGAPQAEQARIVRSEDVTEVHYLCRLGSGEVAAASDALPEGELSSSIYVPQTPAGPVAVTATPLDVPFTPVQEDPFEIEIVNRLSNKITGMREGEQRAVRIEADDVPGRDEKNFIVQLARVRTRAKEMKFSLDQYRNRAQRDPEVGQAFVLEPSFPGTVEAVTEKDVLVRITAQPGEILNTPFGPGVVRDEGQNYRIYIDAKKGGLVRTGGMIGRIIDVDDRTIAVDYRNPFGRETLLCDVTVEKIGDAKLVRSGE